MKALFAVAALLAVTLPRAAGAQTANASPTSPPPPGLVGVPTGVDRVAPTSGERQPRGAPARDQPRIVTESRQEFQNQMKRDDKESHICDRCD